MDDFRITKRLSEQMFHETIDTQLLSTFLYVAFKRCKTCERREMYLFIHLFSRTYVVEIKLIRRGNKINLHLSEE